MDIEKRTYRERNEAKSRKGNKRQNQTTGEDREKIKKNEGNTPRNQGKPVVQHKHTLQGPPEQARNVPGERERACER